MTGTQPQGSALPAGLEVSGKPKCSRVKGFRKALEDAHRPLRGEYFKRGDFTPKAAIRMGWNCSTCRNRRPPSCAPMAP